MARIRTIKPEFPQSESMGNVSRESRLLFVLLWTLADDDGRLRGNSRMLASLLFPYDDDAPSLIDGWLGELERQDCLIRYEAGGSTYLEICNWLIHQKIDKPSKSKIPARGPNSRILANPRERSSEDLRIKDQGSKDQGSKPPDPSGPPPTATAAPSASLEPAEGMGPDKADKPPPEDPPADPPDPPAKSAPAEKSAKALGVDALIADGVPEQVAKDWLLLRKAKRLPLTPTAWETTKAEGLREGLSPCDTVRACLSADWAGFRGDWWRLRSRQGKGRDDGPAPETPYERRARERVEEMAPGIAARAPGQRAIEMFDITGVANVAVIENR